jgi:MinD-like ATPase involved in chromosome partitioning or flagellar assembly
VSGQPQGWPVPRSVLLALGGDRLEEALLAALDRSPKSLRVARRCLDLADLLSAAEAGSAGPQPVAVVSAALPRLDGVAVARLVAAGAVVMAVVDRGDAAAATRLRAQGVTQLLLVEDPGDHTHPGGQSLLAALLGALAGVDGPHGPTGSSSTVPDQRSPAAGGRGDADAPPLGRVVAVWGPVGAPGRTTVAATVADELARRQVETLLADADTYGPSLGQTLGVLDEASGLAAAARDANAGVLDVEALARSARLLRPGLRVLTGVTRADRWPELPASALAVVWQVARCLAVWTVVDCGFCLEQDEEIAYDTLAPRRNGATVTTLQAADVVVAVGAADPVGMQRLIRMLPDLRSAAPQAALRVVLNQVRSGPVGRSPERRLLEGLRRYAGVDSAVLVPADRDSLDAAMAAGRTLAETVPESSARTALMALAIDLADS